MIARFGRQGWIDPLKLQKLLYFTNGWWLGLSGEPLLTERPQVWRYGPVFRGVYNTFSRYGNGRIEHPAPGNPLSPQSAPVMLDANDQTQVDPFLDWVWQEYGGRTGPALSDETHAAGTPWQRIASSRGYSVPIGTEIPTEEDYEYFSTLAKQRGWQPKPFNPQFATR